MEIPKDLFEPAKKVIDACRTAGLRLAVAESCTGGLIAGCLTAVAGSSDVLERGFVVYSNAAKSELLGVPQPLIEAEGAVSAEVARAMAEGCLGRSPVQIAVAVTGIAGPDGGTEEKPVGLVHMAAAREGATTLHESRVFEGDRNAVRGQAVKASLDLVMRVIEAQP